MGRNQEKILEAEGAKIKRLCSKLGMLQTDLVRMSGIGEQSIRDAWRGKKCSLNTIERIVDAVNEKLRVQNSQPIASADLVQNLEVLNQLIGKADEVDIWQKYPRERYGYHSRKTPATHFEDRIASFVNSGSTVMEIGPGPGKFLSLALRNSANEIVAVDPAASRLRCVWNDECELCAAALAAGTLQSIEGLWPSVYIESMRRRFDLIVSQSSLHYQTEIERREFLRTAHRSLKSGGLLAVAVKSIDNAWIASGQAQSIPNTLDRWDCDDHFERTFFTVQNLVTELERAAFTLSINDVETRIVRGYEFPKELTVWIEVLAYKL